MSPLILNSDSVFEEPKKNQQVRYCHHGNTNPSESKCSAVRLWFHRLADVATTVSYYNFHNTCN